ncbi:MAG TPA: glycosyltransferase, partial [Bacteroidia bacterium]|nr:glycosyltransferase [Bacteroidia bacterium]
MLHEIPIKLTYVVSDVSRALGFEWIIEEIDKKKIELSFILICGPDTEMEKFLIRNSVTYQRIEYHNKWSLPHAVLKSFLFLRKNGSVAVHTHLFNGSFIGLIAAGLAGIDKRFYTRHYATLNHEYHPNAVKWDRYLNKKATKIIAVSENVKETLTDKEKVDSKKVVVIPHGFKLDLFH